jgi:hypothetical protein
MIVEARSSFMERWQVFSGPRFSGCAGQDLRRRTMIRPATLVAIILSAVAGVSSLQNSGWTKFVSPDGSFSILMPGVPGHQDMDKDDPAGKITTNIWLLDTPQGLYLVGTTDYPVDINPQRELDLDRDNFLKAVDAKLVSESDFTLKGYPGKEFTGTSAAYTFKSRVLVVGRRAYQYAAREPSASLNLDRVNGFLLSFDLTQPSK